MDRDLALLTISFDPKYDTPSTSRATPPRAQLGHLLGAVLDR